jgi:KDO2-lipid IV(A) lauroyltransferase
MKRLKNSAIRLTLFSLIFFYRTFLWPLGHLLVALLERLAWLAARPERRLAEAQLRDRMGLSPEQAHATARALSRHLARSVIEALELLRRPRQTLETVHFDPQSEKRLQAALESGHGLVFATGHIGNWELMAARIAARFKTATVVKGSYDPDLARWIDRFRLAYGIETVKRDAPDASARLSEMLQNGYVVGVLVDQNTRVPSVDVPFFGAPAPTPRGAATLALRNHVPLFVGYSHRTGLDHTIYAVGPIAVTKTETDPVSALCAAINRELERAIRQRPEQWVWFHKRWK